ncbi:acyl-CoA thioesterase [Sphingobium sp. Z007]|uniref:acyl-CoA thioesterase n=1 Tax=Sphingobium sp. Z007 TaxID=627495 RepID=UPI000B49A887|nr:thioesterase family protein [Sphingobium sp. Z007]
MARPDPALLDLTRYPFRHIITTRFADIDPNHHINNVAMAAAFEDARARFDVAQGHLEAMGDARTMIVANYIDYVGEAHYPAPLDMYVGVLDLGRSSWTLACLATQEGRACAFARAVLVGTVDGKGAPLPETFRAALDGMRVRRDDMA